MSAGFDGLRVLSLESRRADVMQEAILRHGGVPFVAPSVKEIPYDQHEEAYAWAERLFEGGFDLIVVMTGVGLAFLRDVLAERYPIERFAGALRRITVVSRGPKPVPVLHELGVTSRILAPEPNSWREIVAIVAARPERRITVQEYGRANQQFIDALKALGAEVSSISIYRWALPDDQTPLREAVRRIAQRECDVVLFTTSIQLTHLLDVAKDMGLADAVNEALANDLVIGSVGPVMDETLADYGFKPDVVPAHPKLPVLVRAAAEMAPSILAQKRREPEEQCG
jgi:uroporphyrinogen-III synthase